MKKVVRTFAYKREEGQNPYIGFSSFQHFRNESLYSDAVVKPENNMTETENFEGYPIPAYVPQDGRNEGYYPDTTIAYIRILWKEFEPEQGQYNYALLEDVLAKAKAKGQKVMLRLIAHSTRESDDVPDWVKKIMDCPARPKGARIKASPADERFPQLFGLAMQKIGERFDSDPTLEFLDVSLPGCWGEDYNRTHFSEQAQRDFFDIYTKYFPNTQLLGQVNYPDFLRYQNESRVVGWRADGFGTPPHVYKNYPPKVNQFPDLWKQGPVALESYWWLGEWKRQGWDIDDYINITLNWHISAFNAKSLPIPYEWKPRIEYWLSKMGYHFRPVEVACPETVNAGETLTLDLLMENYGVAPIYRDTPLHVRLYGEEGSYVYDTDINTRQWLPGIHGNTVSFQVPKDLPAGTYHVEIGIYSEDAPLIYMCTDAVRNGSFYRVGSVWVKK